jgi:hypothetical protein
MPYKTHAVTPNHQLQHSATFHDTHNPTQKKSNAPAKRISRERERVTREGEKQPKPKGTPKKSKAPVKRMNIEG